MILNYWKEIVSGIVGLLLIALLVSWNARGKEIERLESWEATVIAATSDAVVEPGKDGKRKPIKAEDVPTAIAGLKRSLDNAESTLATINDRSLQEQMFSERLDQQLGAALAAQDKRQEGTLATIKELASRKSTGDATADCAAMSKDSEAAWDGWRK